jgi:hypothetical protein
MKSIFFILSMVILPFFGSAVDTNIDKKLKDYNGCEWHKKRCQYNKLASYVKYNSLFCLFSY